ncbi:MAG TPA: NAD(P)H-binding protein [Candidatus Nitrosotalea sp.]|nr:NAD(P)H-binding protein [Candidatus Nitrosotalea sp.]
MSKNKIAISGASGFVGRNVGKFLAENGYDVVSLARKKGKINFGKTITSQDLTEKNIAKNIRGSQAFLHLIGTGRQTTQEDYEAVNVNLTKNAILLCKNSGIKKIIYLSGLGVGKKSTLGYFISKFKAEQEIIRSGLDYTIFRPSYIMGKGDPLSQMLLGQIAKDSVVIPGSGRYRMQPISVCDVARVVEKAICGKQFSRKIIDLVGPKAVTYNQFVRNFAGKTKIRHVEFEEEYHNALVSRSEFGVDDLSILVGDYVGNHKKLASLSKIVFTGYREMLKACSLA